SSVDARFSGDNRIEITTSGLDGFTLKPAGHPKFSRSAPLTVVIDGTALRTKTRDPLSFARRDERWLAAHFDVSPLDKSDKSDKRNKHAGAEGPISEAVASRNVYVYGTTGSPSADELKARRETAERAADWTGIAGRLAVAFDVRPDTRVNEAELSESNLILFGTKETNRVIAKVAPQFPRAQRDAADYGLLFIAPVDKHHIL